MGSEWCLLGFEDPHWCAMGSHPGRAGAGRSFCPETRKQSLEIDQWVGILWIIDGTDVREDFYELIQPQTTRDKQC